MSERLRNPFNVTKAVDFSDEEINQYWVDLPGAGGFLGLAKPLSPMPMVILGGKGSGKTHLLRHLSYPTQRLRRGAKSESDHIADSGFIGIYMRCGGLNAARFEGKGQPDEVWSSVFAHYMDVWLAQLTLSTCYSALKSDDQFSGVEQSIANALGDAVAETTGANLNTVTDWLSQLRSWQRDLDVAINNAAITRTLQVEIRTSPGRLVFEIPKILADSVTVLRKTRFLYLIDELENLTESQQVYVNTLVREKEAPTSFKIGARHYGLRTLRTLSAGEPNKEGSEYETLDLDGLLRTNKAYPAFARQLVARRLVAAGYFQGGASESRDIAKKADQFFVEPGGHSLAPQVVHTALGGRRGTERPYMARLRASLELAAGSAGAPGVRDSQDIATALELMRVDEYPVLEKANVLLLYQDWSKRRHIIQSARRIHQAANAYIAGQAKRGRHASILSHFRADLVAQLLSESDERQVYAGLATFIDMSRGLPRNLFVILKHIYQWATFNGEHPFMGAPISLAAQQNGVAEAAQWFFRDAEVLGRDGPDVQDGVRRLANLFRQLRLSDKPAECSLSTFSTDFAAVSARSRQVIEASEKWSLLIRLKGGQRDRNTRRVDVKFQLNSMLAPIWDLPIYSRGALALSAVEVDSIFDPVRKTQYDGVVKRRLQRVTAPFSAAQTLDTDTLSFLDA
jgi:hypothetical protein